MYTRMSIYILYRIASNANSFELYITSYATWFHDDHEHFVCVNRAELLLLYFHEYITNSLSFDSAYAWRLSGGGGGVDDGDIKGEKWASAR